MNWNVYYWPAKNKFVIGDSRVLVNLCGIYYTIYRTRSRRPKTLVYVGKLDDKMSRSFIGLGHDILNRKNIEAKIAANSK